MSGHIVAMLWAQDLGVRAKQYCEVAQACFEVLGLAGIARTRIGEPGGDSEVKFDGFDPKHNSGLEVEEAACSIFENQRDKYDLFWGWNAEVCWSRALCGLTVARLNGALEPRQLECIYSIALEAFGAPIYGYMTSVPRELQPTSYAYGMHIARSEGVESLEEELEGLRLSNWLNGRRKVRDGTAIRDVFPFNLLSKQLLAMDVYGETLRQWIDASPRRGLLTALDEHTMLWSLSDGRDLQAVRIELGNAGRLIAHLSERKIAAFRNAR